MKKLGLTFLLLGLLLSIRAEASFAEPLPTAQHVSDQVYSATSATYQVYSFGRLRLAEPTLPLVLDASGNLQLSKLLYIEVEHGSDSGWQYAVTLDHFSVRHALSDGDLLATLPAGYVSYAVQDVVTEGRDTQVSGNTGVFSEDAPQMIMQAEEGAGRGKTSASLGLLIDLPPLIELNQVSGTDRLASGQTIGRFSGDYTAHFTFTLVSGI
ncbi:hypothetical protein [Paenibacillus albidus]|nr:hypothetical protein [Paenibacillus albidus]